MRLLHFALPALVATVACGNLTGPANQTFADAKARWAANGSASYDFTTTKLCFCIWESRAVLVHVRNGAVTSATYVDTGEAVTAALVADIKTVPDLFDMIEAARAAKAAVLSVAYDPTYGYPTRIQIDYSAAIADDEVTITSAGLVLMTGLLTRP